jgi:hypothetical protein
MPAALRATWNPGARRWLNRMTGKVLYESPNGDIWRLVRDPHSGAPVVEHRPNAGSGGRTSATEIGQFLRPGASDRRLTPAESAAMPLFFSNRLGCAGSLLVSVLVTLVLLFWLGVLRF